MRITSFPLNLRSDSPLSRSTKLPPPPSPTTSHSTQQFKNKSRWLTPPDGPSAYVSLLVDQPYTPPPVLSRVSSGLPANPRLSLPASPSKPTAELMITPDTLRYFATTVGNLTSQIHEVQLAQRAAEMRAELQVTELGRLAAKCSEVANLVDSLKAKANAGSERFRRLLEEQKILNGRMENMLRGLMEKASPELSEHETKWFDELKRMKEEIVGGRYDATSLAARTRLLEREHERLLPSLKAVMEKEKMRKDKLAESNRGLGFSQAFEFGERSNVERARIADVENALVGLAAKLEISLERSPSQRER